MSELSTGMNYWPVLNDLRRPFGRLIYSRPREMYFLAPVARWVTKPVVTGLLAERLIEQAGETAEVYRLSPRGRRRWAAMPPDVEVEGACDRCGITRAGLRPVVDGRDCVFMCEPCRAFSAEGEVFDVQQATYSPAFV